VVDLNFGQNSMKGRAVNRRHKPSYKAGLEYQNIPSRIEFPNIGVSFPL
jgi:hypothetical protein